MAKVALHSFVLRYFLFIVAIIGISCIMYFWNDYFHPKKKYWTYQRKTKFNNRIDSINFRRTTKIELIHNNQLDFSQTSMSLNQTNYFSYIEKRFENRRNHLQKICKRLDANKLKLLKYTLKRLIYSKSHSLISCLVAKVSF